jgi:hypothetical protein
LLVSGPDDEPAVYTCESDEGLYTTTFELSPAAAVVEDVPGARAEYWPFKPVRRELTPRIPGARFRHRIQAIGPIEIHEMQPGYR